MARPSGDAWLPLGLNTDPVPGDAERISQEAANLASIAQTLNGQIAALKRIANGNENIGKTADKLRSAASTLAGDLEPVEARYKTVSSALKGWYPELETAQRMSLRALDQAEVPYAKLKNTVAPNVPGFTMGLNGQYQLNPFARPTAAQKTEIANYQTAMNAVQQQLNDAQQLLQQATSLRDTQASHYASVINAASNDSLTDSWWDKFSNWVSDHADILKEIAKILQYVAVGLVILCLLIPGVDLLILAAMAVTAMLLVIHTMLAATGNGNWLDVGMDILGLVTLGMGLGAAEGVEALENTATEAATDAWESGAKSMLQEMKPELDFFRGYTDEDGALTKIGQLGVKNTLGRIAEVLGEKPEAVEESAGFWEKTATQFKANWNTWGSLSKISATFMHGGDPGIAEGVENLSGLAKAWPQVSTVTDALKAGSTTVRWANVAFYSGNAGVLADFGAGRIWRDSYDQWKDENFGYTLSTTQATALADMPGDVLFQGFRVASSFMGN